MTKYSEWLHYFQHNAWSPSQFPFAERPSLSASERELVARSLQQFQLGEGSSGEGLIRRARNFARKREIPSLAESMELFIKEEQRHSAVLGLFLDQEQIPRLSNHWVDHLFRKIRNLAGFELMLTVLVTAEYIAVPYYSALHNATNSFLLKAICKRILMDEAQHLEFQADNLAECAARRSDFARLVTILLQVLGITAACALVYPLHAGLFRAAKMSPLHFWAAALEAYRPIFQKLTRRPVAILQPLLR